MTSQIESQQGTFAYAPDIACYISTFDGVIDISKDIESGQLTRRVNGTSEFRLQISNKFAKYDRRIARMNRVVIFMKRTNWLQLFSGYITVAPYETVVPGSVEIAGECTVKRLMHTYWDKYAPESWALLPFAASKAGLQPDGGAAASVYKILTAVGQWDADQILIQKIPQAFMKHAAKIATKVTGDLEDDPQFQEVKQSFDQLLDAYGWSGVTSPVWEGSTKRSGSGVNLGSNQIGSPQQTGTGGGQAGGGTDPFLIFPIQPESACAGPNNTTFGVSRSYPSPHQHAGMDITADSGANLVAVWDGHVTYGYDAWAGNYAKVYNGNGDIAIYMHMPSQGVARKVKAGEIIGHVDSTGDASGPHLHFEWRPVGGAPAGWPASANGTVSVDNFSNEPASINAFPLLQAVWKGKSSVPVTGGGPGGSGNVPAFNLFLTSYPGMDAETVFFQGERAWINDTPIFESIQQLCTASMRDFQSAPNGDFVAFFPDKLGLWGKAAALEVRDIEIQDFKIQISDENLVTHVAVAGNSYPNVPAVQGLSANWMMSIGLVSVMQQDVMKILLGLDPGQDYKFAGGNWMLQRFGLRPMREEVDSIYDQRWEFFYALQLLQQKWTEQFLSNPTFTFMPEMYPGMLVELKDQGVRFYVEQVTHTFDRTNGFDTQATVSTPMRRRGKDWVLMALERSPERRPSPDLEGAG